MLVAAVIVEDHVDDLAGRDLRLDRVQKTDEFLMPVTLHATADDLAVEHVERGKQGGGAIAFIVVCHGATPAGLKRQPRLGAVKRLDLRLLIDAEHNRMRRRIDIEADDIPEFGHEFRVTRQLELAHPVRLQPVRPPMRCTELGLMPTAFAIISAVQWVVSPGGSPCVSATTFAVTSAPSGGMREGRVLSRNRPSIPARMNRSCQRQTVTLLVPACRMISLVPAPPAVSNTIRARHTCFCGLFRSATIASKHARSAAFTSTLIPSRMPRSPRMASAAYPVRTLC